MAKIFDKKINRELNNERKWSKQYLEENYNIDFTKTYFNLSIADLDFESPKPVVEAIVVRALKSTYSYTFIQKEAIQAISNWYKKLHNITVNEQLTKIVHGTVNAMFMTIKCFTKQKDAVLIQSPIYQPFERSIIKTNRKVVYNQLIYKENSYYIDFEQLEEQIKVNNIKLFLWCNPHNPGGKVWNIDDVLKIIEICNKYQVLLFSDEVHGDLNLEIEHNSILRFKDKIKNFIVCNSPNKTFNLGGLKGSYLFASNTEIYNKISEQYENDSITSPNVFFQPALIAAYNSEESFKWFLELKKYLTNNYLFLIDQLKSIKNIEIMKMETSYLVWIKIQKYTNWEKLQADFYKNNLIVSFSNEFANCSEGWVRINIGLNIESLKIVIEKLKKILK